MFYSANSFEKVPRLRGTERFCVKGPEKHYSGENASKGIEEKKKGKFADVEIGGSLCCWQAQL